MEVPISYLMKKVLSDESLKEQFMKNMLNENKNTMETVTIEKQKLQTLLNNFFEACSLCDELNIYEWEEGDEEMQIMKEWVEKNFGRKV